MHAGKVLDFFPVLVYNTDIITYKSLISIYVA